jgi:predicted DNA-binding antitoxin AbrB/MazE fold protein
MIQIFAATFEDGVFKPDHQPALSESTRVRLIVETANDSDESLRQNAWASLETLWQNSTFDSHGDRLNRDQLHERSTRMFCCIRLIAAY